MYMKSIRNLILPMVFLAGCVSVSVAQDNAPQRGESAPGFTLLTPGGDSVSLSDFRGKYVLLDFWASWCRDCRKENPAVVALDRKYGGDNFVVVGVSMDTDRDAWIKAIEKDSLSWTQVIDLNGWKSDVAKAYDLHWIPTNFLLDPEGKVITSGKNLDNASAVLEEIFGASD